MAGIPKGWMLEKKESEIPMPEGWSALKPDTPALPLDTAAGTPDVAPSDEGGGWLGKGLEFARTSLPSAGAVAGGTIAALTAPVTGPTALAVGGATVAGSMLMRLLAAPETLVNPSQAVREEIFNALSGLIPGSGKALQGVVQRASGAELSALMKGALRMIGAGGTTAAIGQGANVATGQPVSGGQAALEFGLGGLGEGVAGGSELLMRNAPKSAITEAAERTGVRGGGMPEYFLEPKGSAKRAVVETFAPGAGGTPLSQYGEEAVGVLKRGVEKVAPTPSAASGMYGPGYEPGIGDIAENLRGSLAVQQHGLNMNRAQQIEGLVNQELAGAVAPSAPGVVEGAGAMNLQAAEQAAERLVKKLDPTLVIDKGGYKGGGAVSILDNARQQVGDQLNAAEKAVASLIGDAPVDTSAIGNTANALYDAMIAGGAPADSHGLKVLQDLIEETSRPGSKTSAEALFTKLKAIREASRNIGQYARRTKWQLGQLEQATMDSIEAAAYKSPAGIADVKAADDLISTYREASGKYRDAIHIQDAFERASSGALIQPNKLVGTARKASLGMRTGSGMREETARVAAELAANPEAALMGRIKPRQAQQSLADLAASGDPAAMKLVRQTEGGEDWLINQFVQGSATPSVDAAGLAVLTVDRAALSKRIAESGILKNLSDEGKKKLSNIILSGKTIPSAAGSKMGAVAEALADPAKQRGVLESLLSPDSPLSPEMLKEVTPLQAGIQLGTDRTGAAALSQQILTPEGLVNPEELARVTQGLRTPDLIPGAPSRQQFEALFRPDAVEKLKDLGTVGRAISDAMEGWPSEQKQKFVRTIRDVSSTIKTGEQAGQKLAANAAGVPVLGSALALGSITLVPRLVKFLAFTNWDETALRQVARAVLPLLIRQNTQRGVNLGEQQ